MGPKHPSPASGELFQQSLTSLINLEHPLVQLAGLIDWEVFQTQWSGFFLSKTGRPATPPRLIAGLLYLQHTFALSDEALIWAWVENPYWQYFCGETYFQHEPPVDPSSLTRWRKRIGEAGVERLLSASIDAARRGKVVKEKSFDRIIVDTTVMEKAIAYPTDSKLLETGRQHLVKLAETLGIALRQNYNLQAPRLAAQAARYAHARQYRRMRAAIKTQRTLLGRVWRDIQRKLGAEQSELEVVKATLSKAQRLLHQQRTDKNKLYSLHAPEVECIAKGKVRHPYEFGVKVSVAMTHKEGLVVGMKSMPGNPYDGHTLSAAVKQMNTLTNRTPQAVFVDRGYRGVEIPNVSIWRSGQKRGVTGSLKKAIHRRSAIEPAIGHMKTDGRLGRNWLKGALGDALHAMLCGAGHNLRMILRAIRLFYGLYLVDPLRWIWFAMHQHFHHPQFNQIKSV